MALTASRDLNRYVDQELRTFPVAASQTIWKGALVGIDRTSGHVRNLVAGDMFAGIAYEEVNNSAGSGGDEMVRLYTQGDFVLTTNNAVQTLVGAPVYALDDDMTTVTYTLSASYCGTMVALVGTNKAIVRIQPLAEPQTEQAVHVPLSSLTASDTTNPVLITQRDIRMVSMEVSFNTKPDAGSLYVGTHATNPLELVNAFDLTSLTDGVPSQITPNGTQVAQGLRVWAKVTQATSTAGVGGLFSMRYFELP